MLDLRPVTLPPILKPMSLPYCHSRHELEGEANVFYCAHPSMHVQDQRVRAEICQICTYWREPPPETFRPYPPPPPRGVCRYLDEPCGLRECPTCLGNVRVKVFACTHPAHVETTLAECNVCPDHAERELENEHMGQGATAGSR
jgi:hypothetical protein